MSSSPAQGLSKEDTIGILGIPKWTNETPLAGVSRKRDYP